MFTLTIGTTHGGKTLKLLKKRQEKLAETILAHYGGFTLTRGEGSWKDGGTVVSEPVLVYTVHGKQNAWMEEYIAKKAAGLFSQDCVALWDGTRFKLINQEGKDIA